MKKGKSGERYSVLLDDFSTIDLQAETIVKNKLKQGMEIELEELGNFQFESEKVAAFDKAITYMNSAIKTKKQIKDYLAAKKYCEKTILYVLEKLEEYHYVDDLAYAKAYTSTYKCGKGKRLIKLELQRKGVSNETIDEALLEVEDCEETILTLAKKFVKTKVKDEKLKIKLYRFLIGRGFDIQDVSKCAKAVLEDEDDEDWN
ncbi:MAG: RecX family transcriptional regulator [Clostridia bacterium]